MASVVGATRLANSKKIDIYLSIYVVSSRTYKNQLVNRRRFKNHEFSRLKYMIELHHRKNPNFKEMFCFNLKIHYEHNSSNRKYPPNVYLL